ncbi:aspartate carbamoyltransferase catalytic subunit [Antarctobacter jejuensis]|uniref:aspartate carbamoyltransferase catalytic subunit n=1 Tax=Antarctobacter jejuensis TaxID=1439938 RepID=UPI003FD53406
MTQVEINGSDNRTLHVLHLDLPPEAVDRFTRMAGTGEWPLKYGLGASKLRGDFVDVVAIKDLGAMSLSQYLAQAYDVSAKTLGAEAARLDALKGHVVILPAQAFGGTSQILTVATPLRLIGSFGGVSPKPRGAKVTSDSARGLAASGKGAEKTGKGVSRTLVVILSVIAILALFLLVSLIRG